MGAVFPKVSVTPRIPSAVQSLQVPSLTGKAFGLLEHFCPPEGKTDQRPRESKANTMRTLRGVWQREGPLQGCVPDARRRPESHAQAPHHVDPSPPSPPSSRAFPCIVGTGGHRGHGWPVCCLQPRVCLMDVVRPGLLEGAPQVLLSHRASE